MANIRIKLPGFAGKMLGLEKVETSPPPGQLDVQAPGSPKGNLEAPSLPISSKGPPVLPQSAKSTSGGQQVPSNDSAVRQYAEQLLSAALEATPETFRDFLKQRDESLEVLRDSLPKEKLMAKAVELALRSAKLNAADIKATFTAASAAVREKKSSFISELQKEREDQIDTPSRAIHDTQEKITKLTAEISRLTTERAKLEASIGPASQDITEAELRLKEGQQIFESACTSTETSLATMQTQLLSQLTKGGR